jgi:hypothetical protein
MEENNTAHCSMCRQSALPIEEFSLRKSDKRYKTCNGCRARAAQRTTKAAEHDSEPVSGRLLIPIHSANIHTYIMQSVWRFLVAFYGSSTLCFRLSDFEAKRLHSSTILDRSRGGALATILGSHYAAVQSYICR